MGHRVYTRAALVSTNSITQGEQVAILWKPLFEKFDVHIDFAWRTFRWDSESNQKAHVHCVIVGFSCRDALNASADAKNADARGASLQRRIFNADGTIINAQNINAYLLDAPNIFIENRNQSICDVPPLLTGSQRIDDNNYIFTEEEKIDFLKQEPQSEKYFHIWYGADEFINNRPRWVLYLGDCSPKEIKELPLCLERVRRVKEYRLASNRTATVRAADTPNRFGLEVIPDTNFMIVPVVSSEKRLYVPIGFMTPDKMCSNQVNLIPSATLYHFGVLTSSVHMAWMRAVCGRLKSDYRYSKDIVYNNFVWPEKIENEKLKIEKTAQAILDARALYPDSSLADLYDETLMPVELRKAHRANDEAVLAAYGWASTRGHAPLSEEEIVARLFELYEKVVN